MIPWMNKLLLGLFVVSWLTRVLHGPLTVRWMAYPIVMLLFAVSYILGDAIWQRVGLWLMIRLVKAGRRV